MKAQDAVNHRGGWTMLADFAQTLAVSLAAGVLFSLLSVLLVFIVSSVE